VAFARIYATVRPTTLCWISLDAVLESCLPPNPDIERPNPIGWYDAEHVLVTSETRDLASVRLWRVHMGTGTSLLIDEGADAYQVSPAGEFVLATYRADGVRSDEIVVFDIDRPSRRVPIRWRGRSPPFRVGTQLWRVRNARADRITDVSIRGGPRDVPLGSRVQLALSARTQRGEVSTPAAAWWRSLDTTRARVRADGLLTPIAPGDVRVVASLGGWRADTLPFTVTPPRDGEIAFEESWSTLDTTRWLLTGTPLPFVEQRALRVNGDHHLTSGVVSWRSVPPQDGLGLEIRFQLPMTILQWQHLTIGFEPKGTDAQLRGWSGRAGPTEDAIIDTPSGIRSCQLSIPRGDLGDYAGQLLLHSGRESTPIRAFPIDATDGAWHTLRIQLFRDGRCGAAIDNRVVAVSRRPIPMDAPMRVVVHGKSMFTEVRVGALTVWRGERHDVPWFAVDSSAAS
jgi:hypothetical protein